MAKLLVESAIIFFGTLMAAGLLALGEPVAWDRAVTKEAGVRQAVNQLLDSERPRVQVIPSIDYAPDAGDGMA